MTWRLSDVGVPIDQQSYLRSDCPLCGGFLMDRFWLFAVSLGERRRRIRHNPWEESVGCMPTRHRRGGEAEIELVVLDAQGAVRLSKTYVAEIEEWATMAVGVFGSIDDLQAVLEKALSQVVDKTLDDAELRAALEV